MKKIYNVLFYFILVLGYIIFALIVGNIFLSLEKQVMVHSGGYMPEIIIDAGHGGEDGGSVSKNGVLEKNINLAIAKKLKPMLEYSGFTVKMTREEDISIHNNDANSIRQKKVSDINNRVDIANKNPNSILISIHQNEFSDPQYYGSQVFFSKNNKGSKDLAENLKTSIRSLLQKENKRETKPAGKNVYLLKHAKNPAVIVECGFLSNQQELEKLCDDKYRGQMAFAIYCGIINFWQQN